MYGGRSPGFQERLFRKRLRVFGVLAGATFALLLGRFYYLQVIRGAHYRELSEGNRLALVRTPAPRGIIFDRHRRVLAANRPTFSVSLLLEAVGNVERTREMLVRTLDAEPEALRESIRRAVRDRQFEPLTVRDDVPRDRVAVIEGMRYQYPGVQVDVRPSRSYPGGDLAAHLLGYVGEAGPDELETGGGGRLALGETVGKMGVERRLNDALRGIDGGFQVEVDSLGRRLRVLKGRDPYPGCNVILTVDEDVQKAAEEALGDVRGAVVVMDPGNGEVLALVSRPSFDPNLFSTGISAGDWEAIARDARHPMQNRAIQSQYPPGSVYKVVVALAGLQEGVVTEDTFFHCGGGLQFGNRFFRCWKEGGHGGVNLHRAIVESCDTYFYLLGQKLGIDTIARYARELGLGSRTGLDLPGEWAGLVPDAEWKRRRRGQPWYPGETLSAAIGQGYNLLTPLQMAVMISAVANGGDVWKPMLVREILSPDGEPVETFSPERVRRAVLAPSHLEAVRRGMWGVVNEGGGTGGRARLSTVEVAGKTGTAQVVGMSPGGDEGSQEHLREDRRDHAWFACFAPLGVPRVTVVVLVEHGGHGGSVAGPVARKVLEAIFDEVPEDAPPAVVEGEGAG